MISLFKIAAILTIFAAKAVSSTTVFGRASFVREDVEPNIDPLKTVWKANIAHCSIACELTNGCASFSFGKKKCNLFYEQYTNETGIIQANSNVDYYYYIKGNVYPSPIVNTLAVGEANVPVTTALNNMQSTITTTDHSEPATSIVQAATTTDSRVIMTTATHLMTSTRPSTSTTALTPATTSTTSTIVPTTIAHDAPHQKPTFRIITSESRLRYKLYREKATFKDAKRRCKKKRGQLACIHSAEINDEMKRQLQRVPKQDEDIGAWIGLEADGKDGTFKWQDENKIFYSKSENHRQGFQSWIDGNPEDYANGLACVRIVPRSFGCRMGKWVDEKEADCNNLLQYYFCEFHR